MDSKEYFKRLDILRFFAFLAVFISHVTFFFHYPVSINSDGSWAKTFLQVGDLGVSLFFVLSGFLISYLLQKEFSKTGSISLKKFYFRRMLRIWPLYFLVIGVVALVSFLIANLGEYKIALHLSEISSHLLFVGNIYRAFWNTGNEMLSVLWSVGVEEQFYLFWPILFLFFNKKIKWVIIFGIIISFATRFYYHNVFDVREFHTLSVLSDLMIGAWCGIYADKIRFIARWKPTSVWLISGISILGLLWIRGKVFNSALPGWFAGIEPILLAICFAVIIVYSAFRLEREVKINKFSTLLSKALTYLGRISYGLYAFHMVSITITIYFFGTVLNNFIEFIIVSILALVLTVFVAAISYRFWEESFLRFKKRFSLSS